tara:strand:- start:32 stop:772 length:741 start_codon:yes stop_codon:yes gene_type:complete
MNINSIFDQINFKVSPWDNYRKAYLFRLGKLIYKILGKEKEYTFNNCKISKNFENLSLKAALLKIDSMSTYALGHLINQICKNLSSNQLYLNIGCWKGFSLISGMISTSCKVIGVDDFSQFGGPKDEFFKNFNKYRKKNIHEFYEQDYKVFFRNFEKLNKKIDFYFYDGEHSYKNQFENLEIADNFLNEGAIIMIDDINFSEVENGSKDFVKKHSSKYKIIKEIKTFNNHCHPSFWNGVMFIKKNP